MKLRTTQTNTVRVLRTSGLVWAFIKRLPLLACFLLAISTKAQSFVLFGNQLVINLATVNGNTGVSGGGLLQLNPPGTINGNVYVDTTATLNQSGLITGTTFDNQNLTAQQNAVFSISSTLAAQTPTQTISGNQTTALNFNVPSGQTEVVNLDGGLNLDNQNVTLTGGGALILNIENSFTLAGSASLSVVGGSPASLLVNYLGTSTVTSEAGDSVDGQVYLPDAAANLAGTWTGSIFGGGDTITLDSGAIVNPVPEPGAMALISAGLASCFIFARRRTGSLKSSI